MHVKLTQHVEILVMYALLFHFIFNRMFLFLFFLVIYIYIYIYMQLVK
jgi:hypothetical protein